jgi:hypothetical protein
MKFYTILLLFAFIGCTQSTIDYKVHQSWSDSTKEEWINRFIRYLAKPPGKGNQLDRMHSFYDEYYQDQLSKHRLDLYFHDSITDTYYFLISRIAPSLYEKRVATGIIVTFSQNDITYYHEVFRTWKMSEEELEKKGYFLFDLMVKGSDLTPYYPQHSGKDEYIEFPDENTYYDTINRIWVSKLTDPIAPYLPVQ